MNPYWYVTYKNEGRPEKTCKLPTPKDAKKSAEFLRFQGATSVRIHGPKYD